MSEILATSPKLPGEAPTVEGRLADIIKTACVVSVDEYFLSDADRAIVVEALRSLDRQKRITAVISEVMHIKPGSDAGSR